MFDAFLVNKDHPDAMGLVDKLSGSKQPGEIIPLTKGEMSLLASNDFQQLSSQAQKAIDVIDVIVRRSHRDG